jgi:hypothetical protein
MPEPNMDRPILFSTPMVRAILEGRKSQTRRVIGRPLKHPGWTGYSYFASTRGGIAIENGPDYPDTDDDEIRCPYGVPGDRLWVRETWAQVDGQINYRADQDRYVWRATRWKPSIHMPRTASRITLAVTEIRCEQLCEITLADAAAEGWAGADAKHINAVSWYAELWDRINGKRAPWKSNPWVWVVSFTVEARG